MLNRKDRRGRRQALLALLLACAAMLGLAAPAQAHSDAYLEVDNRFDRAAEIWIDGRYAGAVGGDARLRVESRPGQRAVVVQRPNGGAVLTSTRVHLVPRGTAMIRVDPPPGMLRLLNPGPAPLHVSVDGRAPVWITPGTGLELPVQSGRVDLVATVRERHGERVVIDRQVWVEPGEPERVTLQLPQAPPTRGHPPVYTQPRQVAHDHGAPGYDHHSCARVDTVAYR